MPILKESVSTIGDLIRAGERIRKKFKPDDDEREEVWYRGQSHAALPLLPTLYRSNAAEFHYDETSLLDRFMALSTPLLNREPSSEIEWYFLARHHGLPSRLLDWTEDIITAAYFAIEGCIPESRLDLDRLCRGAMKPADKMASASPVVWVIDAGTLNRASIRKDRVVVTGGPISARYLPRGLQKKASTQNALPIGIYPPRSNKRIAAQHGTFTVHGHRRDAIDQLAHKSQTLHLGKIEIKASAIPQICDDLRVMAKHRLSIYQDLDSVAKHVCWTMHSSKP